RSSRDVWLIDADNLRFETFRSERGVYTPRFGAPEMVQGTDGGRPRTDCHAFAAMAFSMLTSLHPFIGALVEEGGDGDWDDDADTPRFETFRSERGVYTPRFGAPEMVQGTDGGRPRTVCHAFSAMAFSMLTSLHPFIGALVEEGADGDWADDDATTGDIDERAY